MGRIEQSIINQNKEQKDFGERRKIQQKDFRERRKFQQKDFGERRPHPIHPCLSDTIFVNGVRNRCISKRGCTVTRITTQPLVLYILEPHARLKKIQEDSRRFKNILKDNPYIISTLRFTKAVRAAPLSRPFCKRARSTNWLTAGWPSAKRLRMASRWFSASWMS